MKSEDKFEIDSKMAEVILTLGSMSVILSALHQYVDEWACNDQLSFILIYLSGICKDNEDKMQELYDKVLS